tara:strand:+ start:620 stop:865 length:246 start_codon:yes stop_codon:yes gene_type:complete
LFQIGFLEIVLIIVLGLLFVGPKRLPELIKFIYKSYKKIQLKFGEFKEDIETDIGTNEIKKDVFNELRMEELEKINERENS